jgi:hypothetical protein
MMHSRYTGRNAVFCAVADIRALIVRDSLVYFVLDDLRDTDPDFCTEEQWTTTRS